MICAAGTAAEAAGPTRAASLCRGRDHEGRKPSPPQSLTVTNISLAGQALHHSLQFSRHQAVRESSQSVASPDEPPKVGML